MSSKKTQEIVLENYPQLLAELQAHVTKIHATLAEIVTRQKVADEGIFLNQLLFEKGLVVKV